MLLSSSVTLSERIMELFLGIDAGGTHTRARLVSDAREVLGTGEAGPANTPSGLPQALRAIEDAYSEAVAQAGLTKAEASSIHAGMGIAGLNRRGFLEGLKAHAFPFRTTAFASDAAIANLGAHEGHDGAIVAVGTGSVGFARVGEDVFTIGGYGFPVSDEGSGAELGLRAIRRALWARDGRIPHTPMTLEILDRFHGSAGEIVDWTARATPADYAAFAPMVLAHALEGESNAELIVQESARRIEAIVRTLLERGAPRCCLVGGLASAMCDWLAPSIRERLSEPLGDPLDGAILLARARAGKNDA
jgi:glucosamine kinase